MSGSIPTAATPHAATPQAATSRPIAAPVWLRLGFWFCILIAVAVVIRRIVALAHPSQSGPPQLAGLDAAFASHAALTLVHIIPALVFVLVLPFFFLRRFAHALWPQRFLYPIGAIVGITAYAMSVDAVGGWIERSAVLFFNSLFLYSLARSYLYAHSAQPLLQRRWMARAVGVLLGIATTRPVMGVTHLEPKQFFGLAFWVGFSINTIAVERWLRSQNSQRWISNFG
jgi:hypothetical protein